MLALSYSGTIEPKAQRVLTLGGIALDIVQATRRKLHIDIAIKELFQIGMKWRSRWLVAASATDIVRRRMLQYSPHRHMEMYSPTVLVLQAYKILDGSFKP